MIASVDQTKTPERKSSLTRVKRYAGEVVYIYAFDVAYEMTRQPVRELLGQPVAQFVVDASKRSPRQLLNHDHTNRWMLILEVTIVLLFVIDLVILVLGLKGH